MSVQWRPPAAPPPHHPPTPLPTLSLPACKVGPCQRRVVAVLDERAIKPASTGVNLDDGAPGWCSICRGPMRPQLSYETIAVGPNGQRVRAELDDPRLAEFAAYTSEEDRDEAFCRWAWDTAVLPDGNRYHRRCLATFYKTGTYERCPRSVHVRPSQADIDDIEQDKSDGLSQETDPSDAEEQRWRAAEEAGRAMLARRRRERRQAQDLAIARGEMEELEAQVLEAQIRLNGGAVPAELQRLRAEVADVTRRFESARDRYLKQVEVSERLQRNLAAIDAERTGLAEEVAAVRDQALAAKREQREELEARNAAALAERSAALEREQQAARDAAAEARRVLEEAETRHKAALRRFNQERERANQNARDRLAEEVDRAERAEARAERARAESVQTRRTLRAEADALAKQVEQIRLEGERRVADEARRVEQIQLDAERAALDRLRRRLLVESGDWARTILHDCRAAFGTSSPEFVSYVDHFVGGMPNAGADDFREFFRAVLMIALRITDADLGLAMGDRTSFVRALLTWAQRPAIDMSINYVLRFIRTPIFASDLRAGESARDDLLHGLFREGVSPFTHDLSADQATFDKDRMIAMTPLRAVCVCTHDSAGWGCLPDHVREALLDVLLAHPGVEVDYTGYGDATADGEAYRSYYPRSSIDKPALLRAASIGSARQIRALVDAGADLDMVVQDDGLTTTVRDYVLGYLRAVYDGRSMIAIMHMGKDDADEVSELIRVVFGRGGYVDGMLNHEDVVGNTYTSDLMLYLSSSAGGAPAPGTEQMQTRFDVYFRTQLENSFVMIQDRKWNDDVDTARLAAHMRFCFAPDGSGPRVDINVLPPRGGGTDHDPVPRAALRPAPAVGHYNRSLLAAICGLGKVALVQTALDLGADVDTRRDPDEWTVMNQLVFTTTWPGTRTSPVARRGPSYQEVFRLLLPLVDLQATSQVLGQTHTVLQYMTRYFIGDDGVAIEDLRHLRDEVRPLALMVVDRIAPEWSRDIAREMWQDRLSPYNWLFPELLGTPDETFARFVANDLMLALVRFTTEDTDRITLDQFDRLALQMWLEAGRTVDFDIAADAQGAMDLRRPWTGMLASAAARGKASLVRLLLERGGDPNWRADAGVPSLHAAVRSGDVDTARLIIDAGFDLETRDAEGKTVRALSVTDAVMRTLVRPLGDKDTRPRVRRRR